MNYDYCMALDDEEALKILLSPSSPAEQAEAIAFLVDQEGYTAAAVAGAIGIGDYEARRMLRIGRNCSSYVKRMLHKRGQWVIGSPQPVIGGYFSLGHARALAGLNHGDQDILAAKAIAGRWSVRKLEKVVTDGGAITKDENAEYFKQLSSYLSEKLGHPVQVKCDKNNTSNGKIEISYVGLDKFDAIVDKMGINLEDTL